MHIMRLFRLLYLLLETGGLTAHALALRLEVSPRTIYRDIEVLGAAGVPVYCQRGKNGGIRLLPGYSVSRALLSGGEQREILAALQGLQATGAGNLENALSKLAALFSPAGAGESNSWVAVDFSDWGQMSARLFDALKGAVIEKQVVTFRYWGTSGRESARTAEPLQLWFKHRTWYLRAWCRTRQASRLFKLSRIQDLRVLDERFERTFNLADFQDKEAVSAAPQVDIIRHIDAASAHRVWDEFAPPDITRLADGAFHVRARFIYEPWVLGYILSFGNEAKVLRPAWLAAEVADMAGKILALY